MFFEYLFPFLCFVHRASRYNCV